MLTQVTIPATNYCWMIIYYTCAALPQTKWLAITMSIYTIAIIIVVRKYARAHHASVTHTPEPTN